MESDLQLKKDVASELERAPGVNAAHIGVGATSGVVTLMGHVSTYGEKHAAESAAKRLAGVRAVANELEVKLPSEMHLPDEEIAANCLTALREHVAVPYQKLRVLVNKGWVTLEGVVEWEFQKSSAADAIKYLRAVRGISNNIDLIARSTANDIKLAIEAAFKGSAEIDSDKIQVEVCDGHIHLRGSVRSSAEKNEAQRAAWSTTGVTAVVNDLVITV
ncbi:MAG TPA: BON domain-containing protein [Kofleriaceae bacterium]|jgi:osmotically-inducible protein OsmY